MFKLLVILFIILQFLFLFSFLLFFFNGVLFTQEIPEELVLLCTDYNVMLRLENVESQK